MSEANFHPQGLSSEQARLLQEQYGRNELSPQKRESFFHKLLHVLREPMFLLLIVAAIIYFILGEPRDGAIMLIFVIAIIGIDAIQEWKTDKTLNALKDLSAPHITVLRDGREKVIASVDLVPGDMMFISEGLKIPADGLIVKANDFCVDESSLTGEAIGIWKVTTDNAQPADGYWRKDYCYAGTLATQGSATVIVDKTGSRTEYGKIGADVASAPDIPTALQKQTGNLVKVSAGIAAVLFAAVVAITYFNLPYLIFQERIIESILSGITLAMAMIPEEFPVILTVFLSLGAWRLAKKQSLVRRLPAVETLGAVSVLCVDKTGTITKNQMTVQDFWPINGNSRHLCGIMGLACETNAYDPMEKAMFDYCQSLGIGKEELFAGELIAEYPFTNHDKMMGHVWKRPEGILVAAKGSPERLLVLCKLSAEERNIIYQKLEEMSAQGLRVIAIAKMPLKDENAVPDTLDGCCLDFCGLVGLADPPRESVKADIPKCLRAGLRVVMITGDNGSTAGSIAKQIGMPHSDRIITGDELNKMSDAKLREKVREVGIFSRVMPEHKMRIVRAFQENGEVVAMTGDGVNDAPALKYADIGIAMGKRGSEVCREAADLILLDDNFSTIVETIRDGRRIYDNIQKAVGYVFTIHIPIALASLLAPLLNFPPASLMFLPLHVVLMELVIDPTCSIVLERQPAEKNIMERKPRHREEKILNAGILVKSLLQGLMIFAASFGAYLFFLQQDPANAPLARTMGLSVILLSNLFLVQVNSSRSDFAFQSFIRLLNDKVMWAVIIGTFAGLLAILYTPLCAFLKLAPLSSSQFLSAIGIAFIAVVWYELVKLVKFLYRRKRISFNNQAAKQKI